jgi:hypothetical protein
MIQPPCFNLITDPVTACALYEDKGPHFWLRRTCNDTTSERHQIPTRPDPVHILYHLMKPAIFCDGDLCHVSVMSMLSVVLQT